MLLILFFSYDYHSLPPLPNQYTFATPAYPISASLPTPWPHPPVATTQWPSWERSPAPAQAPLPKWPSYEDKRKKEKDWKEKEREKEKEKRRNNSGSGRSRREKERDKEKEKVIEIMYQCVLLYVN